MKLLALALCLLAWPAWAQEEPETVGNIARDWASLVNATRHTSMAITALVQERNRLAEQVKVLEAKIRALEEKK